MPRFTLAVPMLLALAAWTHPLPSAAQGHAARIWSDAVVSIEVGDTQGNATRLGGHAVVLHEQGRPLPQVHQLSPGGLRLASFDPAARRILLRDASEPGETTVIALGAITGEFVDFRWLADADGFAVSTRDNVWVARFDTAVAPRGVDAAPVFDPPIARGEVSEVIPLSGGLLIQSFADQRQGTHLARFDAPMVALHESWPIGEATVDAAGRILARVDGSEVASRHEFVRIDVRGEPEEVSRLPCVHPSGLCRVARWVPGTVDPIYALGDGTVVHGEATWSAGDEIVHSLWANSAETRVLAATSSQVMLHDSTANTHWAWRSAGAAVHGAAYTVEGDVVAAVGMDVVRITDGVATPMLSVCPSRARTPDLDPSVHSSARHFVDQLLPLPSGELAYSLVEHYVPTAELEGDEWDRGWE